MLDSDMLADYTQGRLNAADTETDQVLARSLAEVRRWCGWHVTPEREDILTIDGPGGRLLRLPTLNLVELGAVTEEGSEVDLADLEWSRTGVVSKTSGVYWTSRLGGIAVTMTHGFDDAPDFEAAVLSIADRRSQATSGGTAISVGPFRFSEERTPAGAAFTGAELSILEHYRLEKLA